jgi:hypothetical protein
VRGGLQSPILAREVAAGDTHYHLGFARLAPWCGAAYSAAWRTRNWSTALWLKEKGRPEAAFFN